MIHPHKKYEITMKIMKKNLLSFVVATAAILMTVCLTVSCKDDETEDNDRVSSYIATDMPSDIGMTYAVLKGHFYADKMPDVFSVSSSVPRLGMELSESDLFAENMTRSLYSKSLEGNVMEMTVTDLSAGTDYYYRAFVEVGETRLYGNKQSFTTEELTVEGTISDATDITFTSAKVNVSFEMPESVSASEHVVTGIAYASDASALAEKKLKETDGRLDMAGLHILVVTPNGKTVPVTIESLVPGQAYYFCTFIYTDRCWQLGPTKTFTTMPMESSYMQTHEATDVTFVSATLSASTTLPDIFARLYPEKTHISYGMTYAPAKDYPDYTTENKNLLFFAIPDLEVKDGMLTVLADDLEPNTEYIFRPYVIINTDMIAGEVKRFKTKGGEGLLSVESVDAKFVTAEVSGRTLIPSTTSGVRYLFHYNIKGLSSAWDNNVNMTVSGEQLRAVLEQLSANNTYECWISAELNGRTVATSERQTFDTKNPSDYILLDEATDITSSSAVISGELSAEAYNLQDIAHIYYGEDKTNLKQMRTARNTDNRFTLKLEGLRPGTTYYFRAQALCTLSLGWADWFSSEIKSFTTLP